MSMPRKRGKLAQGKGSAPKTSKMATGADEEKLQLYPLDYERVKKVISTRKRIHDAEMDNELKELKKKIKTKKSFDEYKEKCFIEYTERNFPDVGFVTYSVPHFPIGKHNIKEIDWTNKQLAGAGPFVPKQESDLQADNAQRKVGRAFRLLSNKFEREGKDAMFIMSNVEYENVLIHFRDAENKTTGKEDLDVLPFIPERRGEADLIILHKQKGVIFVQVKSVGTHPGASMKSKQKTKEEDVCDQLQRDEDYFKQIMHDIKHLPHMTKVCAFPNKEEKDVNRQHLKQGCKDGVLLSKHNLFDDTMEKAERDYDLRQFQEWWDSRLPDRELPPGLMKNIIGRYIGSLSRPRATNFTTERSHVRTVADAVGLAARYTKTLCMNLDEDLKQAITPHSDDYKRVHLKGPPGSGRTTMLILKARAFLKEATDRHVVVLDLNRGSAGRPVGFQICSAVKQAEDVNVHHLPLDLHEDITSSAFQEKVQDELGTNVQEEYILFVVDEVLPKEEWLNIVDVFQSEKNPFKASSVWCADGIVSAEKFDNFKIVKLSGIYRIPASVQRILHFTDWDDQRAESYVFDVEECTSQIHVTNGPTPVCIKHKEHGSQEPLTACTRCATELANIMKNMKFIQESTQPGPSPQPGTSAQLESTTHFLPCSVTVLFGLPEDYYKEKQNKRKETTLSKLNSYTDMIRTCDFIKTLEKELSHVHITLIGQTEKNQDLDMNTFWNDITLSWIDNFQGLERDVVIFLPGVDEPGKTRSGSSYQQAPPSCGEAEPPSLPDRANQNIPMPGLGKESPHEEKKKPAEGGAKETAKGKKKAAVGGTAKPGLADDYWRVEDLQRYTAWDRSNLTCAATRCSGQLILVVP